MKPRAKIKDTAVNRLNAAAIHGKHKWTWESNGESIVFFKNCVTCGALLPVETGYYRKRNMADGYTSDCRKCRKIKRMERHPLVKGQGMTIEEIREWNRDHPFQKTHIQMEYEAELGR